MSSYRCPQCGLTNWINTEFCKRCKVQNPHLAQYQQTAAYANNTQYNEYAPQTQAYAPQNFAAYQQPDYSAPPPPNAFGNAAGTAAYGQTQQTYYRHQPHYYNQPQPLSPDEQRELEEAKKQIKGAWVSGVIVCVISVLFAFAQLAFSAKSAEDIGGAIGIIVSVVILGGLSLGVYFKSRACAVILCILYILDKIVMFALEGKAAGIIVTIIFVYYFGYGIKGTFTHYRLTKGRM